jgi:DNA-binding phage protein
MTDWIPAFAGMTVVAGIAGMTEKMVYTAYSTN